MPLETVAETAEKLGVSERTVWRLIKSGELRVVRFSGVVRVLRTGGAFAFTVETLDSGDFALRDTCHHAHGEGYIRQLAAENHLDVVLCEPIDNMRFGIKGTLFWLEKAD